MQTQVGYRLAIEFDDLQVVALLNEELRKHAHTRAYLEHGEVVMFLQCIGNAFGDGEIGEEVLPQVLLGPHLVAIRHGTHLFGVSGTIGITTIPIVHRFLIRVESEELLCHGRPACLRGTDRWR